MELIKENGCYEILFIFHTPHCSKFSLIDKFWSSARKRLRDETGMDSAATFTRHGETIKGIITPSRINPRGGEYENEEFIEHCWLFEDALRDYAAFFVDALCEFKRSNLYGEYLRLIEVADNENPIHALINPFLLKIGLKTEEDEEGKAAFENDLAEERKAFAEFFVEVTERFDEALFEKLVEKLPSATAGEVRKIKLKNSAD